MIVSVLPFKLKPGAVPELGRGLRQQPDPRDAPSRWRAATRSCWLAPTSRATRPTSSACGTTTRPIRGGWITPIAAPPPTTCCDSLQATLTPLPQLGSGRSCALFTTLKRRRARQAPERNGAAGSWEQERGTLVRIKSAAAFAVVPVFALALAACGSSTSSETTSSAAAEATAAVSAEASAVASEAASPAAESAVKKVAFFGFWKSNSFTQAVLAGVQEAADAAGIEVVDLTTAEYDGVAQIKAVQDQTVKGDAADVRRSRFRLSRHGHSCCRRRSTPVSPSSLASRRSARTSPPWSRRSPASSSWARPQSTTARSSQRWPSRPARTSIRATSPTSRASRPCRSTTPAPSPSWRRWPRALRTPRSWLRSRVATAPTLARRRPRTHSRRTPTST